jgi:hypothetical protein
MHSQFSLLTQKRFLPFFTTQALGAFNDNVYKNVLVILATYHTARYSAMDLGLLTNLAAGLFIFPYLLFSGIAGQLADKYDKTIILRTVKICEIAIMLVASIGLVMHLMSILLLAVFLMGAHSTFFAPAKYGLLPEILVDAELTGGNALLEMGTFIAIVLGTLLAGLLAGVDQVALTIGVLMTISVAGFLSSRAIPSLNAIDPTLNIDWNIVRATFASLKVTRAEPLVLRAIIAISWFWLFGVVILTHIPMLGARVMHGTEGVVTLLLVGFSVGIGIGSLACERITGRALNLGLVPIGSLGLSLVSIDLSVASSQLIQTSHISAQQFLQSWIGAHILADVLLMGIAGGLYIVPLYTLMTQKSPARVRSRIVSANSIWNALFMVVGSLLAATVLARGWSVPQLLLGLGFLNVVFATWLFVRTPEFIRALYSLLVRSSG